MAVPPMFVTFPCLCVALGGRTRTKLEGSDPAAWSRVRAVDYRVVILSVRASSAFSIV